MDPSLSFQLTSARSKDVPALVQLHTAAFQSDQFSNFMLYGREHNAHQTLMTKSLAFWMSDPAAQIVQAVDSATGHVLGWACWVRKGEEDTSVSQGQSPTVQQQSTTQAEKKTVHEPSTAPKTSAQMLGGRMHGDMAGKEKLHMDGGVYMVLQSLATDPNYQRRGIGSKLVQWGLDQADAEGLPCWIHASDAGRRVYEAAGFEQVGYDEYDLDVWATKSENMSSQGWGSYTFRYMVRESKTIGTTPTYL